MIVCVRFFGVVERAGVELTVGQVLFYHSNCKDPGIAAFGEVSDL